MDLLKQPAFIDQPNRRRAQARLPGTAGNMGNDLGIGTGPQGGMPVVEIQRVASGEELAITHPGGVANRFVSFRFADLAQHDQILEPTHGGAAHTAIRVMGHQPAQRVVSDRPGLNGRPPGGRIRGVNVGTRGSP